MSMLLKKLTQAGIVFTCLLLANTGTHAQTAIPASFPDQPIATATSVQTVNCDMVECPLQGGVRLSAIVWDDAASQTCSLYVDYTGNPTPVQLSLPPTPSGVSFLPDVVIGNARRKGDKKGTHVIGVVYLDPNNYVTYYSWYLVNGVGGALTVSYAGTIPLSGAFGPYSKYPHIDAFADNINQTGGLPSLYDFVATWEEHTVSGPIITVGAVGPIEGPGLLPSYQISTGTGGNEMPDVAAITDINTGARTALFAYNHMGGVEYSEFDVASSTVTYSTMYGTPSGRVRIEAMNLYDPSNPSLTKYQIAAETWVNNDIECYNNNFYPSVWGGPLTNADPTLFPSATNYTSPAVAAGTGIGGMPSNIGNQVYSIGMSINGTGNLYGRQIDINGGTFPGFAGGNDYYAINQNPLSSGSPLALSSSSNSGYDLLSVWFDGNFIMRKFSNNMFAFKNTAGLAGTGKEEVFTLSPNPAQDRIVIKGTGSANYVIKDITGRTISTGTLNAYETSIDVGSLSKGLYLVNVYDNGKLHVSRFVKE